ncbi:MAG: glycosyltransferase family 4 protein [Planctomycetes bacterium]|nr:glycosyltransferase family 4 protein [Planctomycetota bacterium]
MTRICHLFDESVGWEQRVGARQLVERTTSDDSSHVVASIDARGSAVAKALTGRVERFCRLGGFAPTVAPSVQRYLRRTAVECIYAWGLQAALAARAASNRPLVIPWFDPEIPARDIKLLRSLARPERFAVSCASESVRRRLIESGVPPDNCVVIRPAVDFALIRRCRGGELRRRLRIDPDDYVAIIPEPRGLEDRAMEVFWAVYLLTRFGEKARLIVPGRSRTQEKICRLDRVVLESHVVVTPPSDIPFEQLVTVSDALVVVPKSTTSTTSIAWAMASGSAVIASAVYAVAELIANKVNGLLFNPKTATHLAGAVGRLLMDRDSQTRVKEVARGHAFEVFGLRRYVDQHDRLRRNLATGCVPREGIVDSAVVS